MRDLFLTEYESDQNAGKRVKYHAAIAAFGAIVCFGYIDYQVPFPPCHWQGLFTMFLRGDGVIPFNNHYTGLLKAIKKPDTYVAGFGINTQGLLHNTQRRTTTTSGRRIIIVIAIGRLDIIRQVAIDD